MPFSFQGKTRTIVINVMLAILSLSLLAGCASIVGYERMYAGAPQPLSRIALLTHPDPYGQIVLIFEIDGRPAFLAGVTELSAGKHTVTAGLATSGGYSSTIVSEKKVTIGFTAEAGHAYTIYPLVHTHKPRWQPAIWDITAELAAPQHRNLVKKIDAILLKNRGVPSASVATLATVSQPKDIRGFSEEIATNLEPWVGKDLPVNYTFYRYKPYLAIKAEDKAVYHLQIDQRSGQVADVFGRALDVAEKKTTIVWAYQPLGSALAYQLRCSPYFITDDDVEKHCPQVYEQQPGGSFKPVARQ